MTLKLFCPMYLVRSVLLCVLSVSTIFYANAQDGDWKEETTKSGKVHVKYKVYTEKDKAGEERMVANYTATSIVSMDIDKAEKFLRNSENHKKVLDNTEVSKKVASISDDQWVQYLYMDIPWPMPNADCVQRVSVDRKGNELTVSVVAVPDAYPMQGEKRMDISDMKYHFVLKAPGSIELSITGRFSPIGSVNKFLMETWFPKGPEGLINRLVEEVNKL